MKNCMKTTTVTSVSGYSEVERTCKVDEHAVSTGKKAREGTKKTVAANCGDVGQIASELTSRGLVYYLDNFADRSYSFTENINEFSRLLDIAWERFIVEDCSLNK